MTNEAGCSHKQKYTREMASDGQFFWIPEPSCQLCEIERLRAVLKKFGRHPTGDMEGAGRCAGFQSAAPFREDLCDCGLNAALAGNSTAEGKCSKTAHYFDRLLYCQKLAGHDGFCEYR